MDEDADWELDVDEVGRAPPPYRGEGEWKGSAGLPAYEEVCGGTGVLGGEGRLDEVAPRRSGGEGLSVPERVVRRGSEGDWRGVGSRDRDRDRDRNREEGRRGSS